MPVANDSLLSRWPFLENIPECDKGMMLAQAFLQAAGECVNTLGKGRTSSSRASLLIAYNTMVMHGDACEKCNRVSA